MGRSKYWPLLLPDCIRHILQYVYDLTHWNTEKKKVFLGKTIWLEVISKDSSLGIPKMPNLPKAQPWKTHPHFNRAFSLAFRPLWGLANDFIQLPPCQCYKYELVMICMRSYWLKAFSCSRSTAIALSKILFEEIFPTWGIPTELHSD